MHRGLLRSAPSGAINSAGEQYQSEIDLLKINVNDHIEKKNNLSYLSLRAWAWAEALRLTTRPPLRLRHLCLDENVTCYIDINGSCHGMGDGHDIWQANDLPTTCDGLQK
jgi:hypothetical protein